MARPADEQSPAAMTTPALLTFAELLALVPLKERAAGRLLDGREWNEFPEVRS